MHRPSGKRYPKSVQFWLLLAFLGVTALLGGGARGDVASLVILRPLAGLLCGVALATLRREQVTENRGLFAFAAAVIVYVAIQLVPLPPVIWHMLPGREIVAQIDTATGLGPTWRPISMAPLATWNALYSLLVPLVVLLLCVQIPPRQRRDLLPFFIAFGVISGLIGLLQVTSGYSSPLYFYRITNHDAAVGLFANRNHQAIFLACIFPMAAVLASTGVRTPEQARVRTGLMIAVALVIFPLLLVTGSRAGFVLGLIGIASTVALYRRPALDIPTKRKTRTIAGPMVLAVAIVAGIALLMVLFTRAKTLSRITAADQLEDLRFRVWGPIVDMAWTYFPTGSGIGSFAEVFQVHEPEKLLRLSYLNHAHNDWLEVYMTGGLIGCALLLTAVVVIARDSLAAWRNATPGAERTFGRLASVLFAMLGLASVADYPLRAPSIACLAVVAIFWLGDAARARTFTATSTKNGGSLGAARLADQAQG
ncbi:O-antigen ligase [Sphingomonas naasensis]|uniref:O-antigen ligase domain-containing protein n=1 Tax=Sphingomonas naasensis TaxID=1344951 RepID=A0A4S1WSR9_9SPHN|nr:O-antigen ligase family protein [Sphingomonas naasensis]NIJ19284.1 O-antigen ligase [Sphingomonas naasensis]TGX46459.1 O-antigen ligase domain-containing protein [Sphingomonas naasensis]